MPSPSDRTRPELEPALVVWDWNGTLLDDQWLALDCANGMLERRGLPTMDAQRYREVFDFPVRTYYERAGFDFSREPFELLADEFIAAFNARVGSCRLHPGARSTLQRISARGITQVVLSASRQTSLEQGLAVSGVRDHFSLVRGLDDHLAVSKRERGLALLEELDVDPERTMLIGDTTHDAAVAEAMGISAVLVAAGHQSRERLLGAGVPVVDRLEQLPIGHATRRDLSVPPARR